jgi:hypothetical protein
MQLSRERINRAAVAAHERTTRQLRTSSAPDCCEKTSASLARELDDAFAAARSEGVPLACAPGCAFCCHLRVSVFAHVAVALLHHLRTRLPAAEATDAEKRIVANAARIDGMTAAEHYAARMPCALLVNGRCCAYEARPSACAAHHSLSRARCERAFEHPAHHGTPKNSRPASLELQALGDALIAATQSALQDNGAAAIRRELHQSVRDLL